MQNTIFHITSFTFFLLNVYFNISLAGNVPPACLTAGGQHVFWVDVYALFICHLYLPVTARWREKFNSYVFCRRSVENT